MNCQATCNITQIYVEMFHTEVGLTVLNMHTQSIDGDTKHLYKYDRTWGARASFSTRLVPQTVSGIQWVRWSGQEHWVCSWQCGGWLLISLSCHTWSAPPEHRGWRYTEPVNSFIDVPNQYLVSWTVQRDMCRRIWSNHYYRGTMIMVPGVWCFTVHSENVHACR